MRLRSKPWENHQKRQMPYPPARHQAQAWGRQQHPTCPRIKEPPRLTLAPCAVLQVVLPPQLKVRNQAWILVFRKGGTFLQIMNLSTCRQPPPVWRTRVNNVRYTHILSLLPIPCINHNNTLTPPCQQRPVKIDIKDVSAPSKSRTPNSQGVVHWTLNDIPGHIENWRVWQEQYIPTIWHELGCYSKPWKTVLLADVPYIQEQYDQFYNTGHTIESKGPVYLKVSDIVDIRLK